MPHKDCTCNSRTVDESGNVLHFEECEKEKYKIDELIDILENRIKELKHADSEFCKDRWDMSKPEFERNIYREQSNNVTFARQEIETILNKAKEIKDGK